MEITLERYVMVELGQMFYELLMEGYSNDIAYDMMKEVVRNERESDIWEMVDSEENENELEFSDVLYEIMLEVEELGNYYLENNQAE